MDAFTTEVLAVIRATRALSLPQWGRAEVAQKKSASATDVVTQVDFEIEQFLEREFSKLDSSITFVGEEFGGDRGMDKFWLVDPIDGTAHYIRGLPFCTTMVARIEGGHVVFSAIYDFVQDTLYHASVGNGAYKDHERISVSSRPIGNAYIGYESNLKNGKNLETYLRVKDKVQTLNMVTSGYEFVMVATGKIEGRVCLDPFGKDYDFAPGTLLVAEAGGRVTNIGSSSYDYAKLDLIAANPQMHEFLTAGEDALFPVLREE